MPRPLRRDRKPVSSLADLDRARIALGVYLDKQEFIDAMLIPIRRRRRLEEGPRPGMTPGTCVRKDGSDPAWEDPAPPWAAFLVLRVARLFFEELSWQNLGALTRRLVQDEQRTLAAQAVLLSFFPNWPPSGEDDQTLKYGEAMRVYAELEKVAWS